MKGARAAANKKMVPPTLVDKTASPHEIPSFIRSRLLVCLALAVSTVSVYHSCLDHPFVNFDDQDYVTENPQVEGGLTVANIGWAFTTFQCGNWHPLTWLSLQLDAGVYGGLKAGGFHLTNVLLHTISVMLLFLVLDNMTGMMGRSAAVAALFALHPLSVEPVAWIAERKGVLSAFFWMLTLAAYVNYVRTPNVRRYLLVVIALVLGLMAKPLLMTLPFALLLLDYWPLGRWRTGAPTKIFNLQSLIVEKLPLFLIAGGWCGIAVLTQAHVKALPSLERYPLDIRIWNALQSYVIYLGKLVWPLQLAVYYPHLQGATSRWYALAAGIFLILISALVLGPGRRLPYLMVGWFWYLGTLVPMIGLIQIGDHGMADRYVYVPMIGLFLMMTWGASDLAARRHWPRPVLAGLGAVTLIACAALTVNQIGYWKSDRALWDHALAVTSKNAMAHNNLGMEFYREGKIIQAKNEFEKAVKFDPGLPLFHHNLATLLQSLGRRREALAECRRAIELDPEDPTFHFTLGNLLRDEGQSGAALAELEEAVRLRPTHALARNNLANLLVDLGRDEEAMAQYRQAIDADPHYDSPHIGLGNALARQGNREGARAEFLRAIELNPGGVLGYTNLGLALQADGRLDEAGRQFRRAADLGSYQALALLRSCEQMAATRPKLDALVSNRSQPADNAERLALAELCGQPFIARFALGARLYAEAFRVDPALGENLPTGDRTAAAIAAASAGCGLDQHDAGLDDKEKARWRDQALTWLRADLALWAGHANDENPRARAALLASLRTWQRDAGLAGVRNPSALAILPVEERGRWTKFWQDVETLLARVRRSV